MPKERVKRVNYELNDDEIFLKTGNGCKRWVDCFTCPYKDCVADHKEFLEANTIVKVR